MKQVLAITRKELQGYFGSPMALDLCGRLSGVTLFSFFWVETFFARGIADVRPLFRWMPVLMIFLVAALTMRQWSEEQRSGTLEVLLTLPVSAAQLVLGKFLAVMALVAVSLALTLFRRSPCHCWATWTGGRSSAAIWPRPAGRGLCRHRPVCLLAHRQPDRGADLDGAAMRRFCTWSAQAA